MHVILSFLTLSPCAPNRVSKGQVCDALPRGDCTCPSPLFKNSRVVIPVTSFLLERQLPNPMEVQQGQIQDFQKGGGGGGVRVIVNY